MPTWPSIVADRRHHDPRPAGLVDHILEVIRIGKFLPTAAPAILVIRLVENHRSAIGDLVLGNETANVRYIAIVDEYRHFYD